MRVKCLAQEHNAVPRSGLEPGPPDPESSALTIRPPRLPMGNSDVIKMTTACSAITDQFLAAAAQLLLRVGSEAQLVKN